MVFQRICVKEGIFANFWCSAPVFLSCPTFKTSEIVSIFVKDFKGSRFLPVTSTIKGMLFKDPCTREGTDFGSKCVLMRAYKGFVALS